MVLLPTAIRLSMSWVRQNLSRSCLNCPAWPSHPSPGQLLLSTRACWGMFQCSAGAPGQGSGEEVSGHPWNFVEIPFFSVICFWAYSHSRRAATWLMLFEDKECTYSDLFHMLLFIFITKFKPIHPRGKTFSYSVSSLPNPSFYSEQFSQS